MTIRTNTNPTPVISIIVPVYNAAPFLSDCLNSLLAQSYENIEILCINDGSIDGSLDILKAYAKTNHHIKIFDQKNSGPARARNVGLEKACGEFIMFCDADDTYCQTFCENMLLYIKKYSVDYVMCHINTFDKNKKITNSDMWFPFDEGKKTLSVADKYKTNVYLWNKIFRKSIIDLYNIKFPEGHKSDDNAFIYEYLAVSHSAYYLNKKLYNHNDCEGSIMNLFYSDNIKIEDLTDKPIILLSLYRFIMKHNILEMNKDLFSLIVYKELRGSWQNVPVVWEKEFLRFFSEIFLEIPEQHLVFDDKTFFKIYNLLIKKDFYAATHVLDCVIKGEKKYRRKYCVQFPLKPAFDQNNVPVVFNSDDNYVKYLSVAIKSILNNSNSNNNYDIVILTEDISEDNQILLTSSIKNTPNVSIRFYDMNAYSKKYEVHKFPTVGHVRAAAYYRLFISEVFAAYNKIIYLDSDLILNTDVALLLQENLEGNSVGAVLDYHVSQIEQYGDEKIPGIREYGANVLGITNWSFYFNSGVLVCDIQRIREKQYLDHFINIAKINNKYYNDQNVLNSVLQGDVKILDDSWNIQLNGGNNLTLYSHLRPLSEMKIIHYCGRDKVWNMVSGIYTSLWWGIARQSIYYEQLLNNLLQNKLAVNDRVITLITRKLDSSKKMVDIDYNRDKWLYFKYKILSKITLGKTRKKYKQLKKDIKWHLKEINQMMNKI